MSGQCCCKVADAGQTLTEHWVNVRPTHNNGCGAVPGALVKAWKARGRWFESHSDMGLYVFKGGLKKHI